MDVHRDKHKKNREDKLSPVSISFRYLQSPILPSLDSIHKRKSCSQFRHGSIVLLGRYYFTLKIQLTLLPIYKMERTPLRVTFYFLTQVTINVEHAVLWCKVDPKIALFIPIMGKKNTLLHCVIVPLFQRLQTF